MTTGQRIVQAFETGDHAALVAQLAPDATFHSPVTHYDGRERIAAVLAAVTQVVTIPFVSQVYEAPGETAAFFTATLEGRRAQGVLLVQAAGDAPATGLTLWIRPLKSLLTGIERMRELMS
jgi:SnoaL-like domain